MLAAAEVEVTLQVRFVKIESHTATLCPTCSLHTILTCSEFQPTSPISLPAPSFTGPKRHRALTPLFLNNVQSKVSSETQIWILGLLGPRPQIDEADLQASWLVCTV